MTTHTSPRMQVNADWTQSFDFQVNAASWTIHGRAASTKNSANYVNLNSNNLIWSDANNGVLQVYLTKNNCATLGVATINIEVIRTDPTPIRPILRFIVQNNAGIAS